jgi:hypothetical protein
MERHGTPLKVYISIDVLRDVLINERFTMLGGLTNLVWRGSCGDVPMQIVLDKRNYVMVEDYLDVVAEQELLGED